ncbi:alpha/beta-hydrolase [Xylariaceae sp. FL1272]|nr:alpha/beta-hydrolase [Xylariaceae sp. FL1272]
MPHAEKIESTSVMRPAPEQWLMGTKAYETRMPHHDNIRALWETKWKFPCSKSVYPFHDGAYSDFEPIFSSLIASSVTSGSSAEYTQAFFPAAKSLEEQGDALAQRGDTKAASDLYLRASAVLRIARFTYITSFPEVNDLTKWRAWEMQKRVYMKAASRWDVPVKEVFIPHKHRSGRDRETIPAYVRLPAGAQSGNGQKCPVVLLFTGLDGYRPDNTVRSDEFVSRGWAAVIVEIPGTADCPADPADPAAPERLWDSVFAWMDADGRFDVNRVLCWGLSSGGYYAVRAAHTHAHRLQGAVAQGAGTHYFFDPVWLERAGDHEYPFDLLPALAAKHGFGQDVDGYKRNALKKFSLLENGILEQPSCRLLLINGMLDGLMPIEDSMLLFEYGTPKEARFFPGALHMGYPMANSSVYPWMEEVMNAAK